MESSSHRASREKGVITLNRILYGSFALFMALVGGGVVFLLLTLFEPEPDTLLGPYVSPFQVLTNTVPAGSPAVVRGERCVLVKESIDVKISVTLRQLDGPYVHQDLSGANASRAGGCNVTTQVVGVPADAPAGRYRIDGLSVAVKTGEGRIWWSDEFEVARPMAGALSRPAETQ